MVTKNCNSSVGTVVRQDLCWDVLIGCEERNRRVKQSVCIHEENMQHASPALLPHDFARPHLTLLIKFSQDTRSKPKSQESPSACLKGCLPYLATQCSLKKTWNWDRKGLQRRVRQKDQKLYLLKPQGSYLFYKENFNSCGPLSHPKIPALKISSLDFPAHILRPFDTLTEDRGNLAVTGLQEKKLVDLDFTSAPSFQENITYYLKGEKMTETSGEGCALFFFFCAPIFKN